MSIMEDSRKENYFPKMQEGRCILMFGFGIFG
jgi:hypothetical protein